MVPNTGEGERREKKSGRWPNPGPSPGAKQGSSTRTKKSFKNPTTKEKFEMLKNMKEEYLESYLCDFLKGHRYLMVSADVWDIEAWESLRKGFANNNKGNRIIITTEKFVVEHCNERSTYVHELPFLQEEERWELFWKKVFQSHNEADDKMGCHQENIPMSGQRYKSTSSAMQGMDQMEFDPMDLINLQELNVLLVGESNRFTLDSTGRLKSLQSFGLTSLDNGSAWFPPLQPLSHCQHLLQMRLCNKDEHLLKPTELQEFQPNLKFLFSVTRGMREDPMAIFEKLPKLTILELYYYHGNKFACTAGGFPQLQFLHDFRGDVEELQLEGGGMPLLKDLRVEDLVRIPERLRSIPALPRDNYFEWPY
ncbi:hypothetical protein Acr_10g0001670 [Actinidia rufa]|uniref:NB-ARC domain-containing protein n=1 Tax=Actinidia rufa TaxID=165716 RepID=A0A7J0F7U9_9ERIC|nr:hypothetical protein Acr_10g0001670 [Actinidia rufa]